MPSRTSNTSDAELVSIAVDFGGTKTAAARLVGSRIVDRLQLETDANATPDEHLAAITGLIEELKPERTTPLGVAVSGRVDKLGRWSTVSNKNLDGFSEYPLREKLQEKFEQNVIVMNDAVAAAWGEYNCLPPQDRPDSFLYITVSTGVGGGLILRGRPFVSEHGLAGHFGFMTSTMASDECGCGRTATLESVASGTAIGHGGSLTSESPLTGREVFERHIRGDELATASVERSAKAMAVAIADVRALLDISVVAIGGSVGLADGYIGLVRRYLDDEPKPFRAQIAPALLGGDSALVGVVSNFGEE
jgi:N-acylmannosamine kinase